MSSLVVRYAPLAELWAAAPDADRWLSAAERETLAHMRSAERRETWLAGRVLAKRVLGDVLRLDDSTARQPAAIHVDSRSERPGHGERPRVFVGERLTPCALSISHTSRGVLVAASPEPRVRVGVDLVRRGTVARPVEWAFTPNERRWLAAEARHRHAPEQVWALKEALYKACQEGEGFAPAHIEVVPGRTACYPQFVPGAALRHVQSWRVDGHCSALVVVVSAAATENSSAVRPRALAA